MDDYYQRVYRIVEHIPYGRVTTYGAIARYLGIASGARMVGYALNKAMETDLPAHRVVNRNGELTGRSYFPDDTMRERLEQEKIAFSDEYKVDLDLHFWDPNEEMKWDPNEEMK